MASYSRSRVEWIGNLQHSLSKIKRWIYGARITLGTFRSFGLLEEFQLMELQNNVKEKLVRVGVPGENHEHLVFLQRAVA